MFTRTRVSCGIMVALLLAFSAVSGADELKPYILASQEQGSIDGSIDAVKASLMGQGFEIAGEYSPYDGAHVIVVTSSKMQSDAARSEFGAYGAIQRVALTETDGGLQVSYTNPPYYTAAYRMDCDPSETFEKLQAALGNMGEFGSKDGRSSKDLRKYHYMVMMPSFDDPVKLAKFSSQEEALAIIEKNLAAKKGGNEKVYRVDIPGEEETVIGIGISEGNGADAKVMGVTDFGDLKHTAHLPYELVVSEGTAYMLHGKFRIALDFPDLKMVTFMKISSAPGGIEDSFKELMKTAYPE